MPVLDKEYDSELPLPSPIEIGSDLFEDLNKHFKRTEFLIEENNEDKRKIEKLSKGIEQAHEIVVKGEDKIETLLRRNASLKAALEDAQQRIANSVAYWKDFGFDVTKVSKDGDNFEEYDYIYYKLGGDQQPATDDTQEPKYTIGLKFHEKQLEIVRQNPEILDSEALTALNEKLSKTVDYKSAMILIKKTLTSCDNPRDGKQLE